MHKRKRFYVYSIIALLLALLVLGIGPYVFGGGPLFGHAGGIPVCDSATVGLSVNQSVMVANTTITTTISAIPLPNEGGCTLASLIIEMNNSGTWRTVPTTYNGNSWYCSGTSCDINSPFWNTPHQRQLVCTSVGTQQIRAHATYNDGGVVSITSQPINVLCQAPPPPPLAITNIVTSPSPCIASQECEINITANKDLGFSLPSGVIVTGTQQINVSDWGVYQWGDPIKYPSSINIVDDYTVSFTVPANEFNVGAVAFTIEAHLYSFNTPEVSPAVQITFNDGTPIPVITAVTPNAGTPLRSTLLTLTVENFDESYNIALTTLTTIGASNGGPLWFSKDANSGVEQFIYDGSNTVTLTVPDLSSRYPDYPLGTQTFTVSTFGNNNYAYPNLYNFTLPMNITSVTPSSHLTPVTNGLTVVLKTQNFADSNSYWDNTWDIAFGGITFTHGEYAPGNYTSDGENVTLNVPNNNYAVGTTPFNVITNYGIASFPSQFTFEEENTGSSSSSSSSSSSGGGSIIKRARNTTTNFTLNLFQVITDYKSSSILRLTTKKLDRNDYDGRAFAYQVFELESSVSDADITEANLRFRVSKSWMNANNIGIGSIIMQRLEGSTWKNLLTNRDSGDTAYAYYTAISPGFSRFAIVGIQGSEGEEEYPINETPGPPPTNTTLPPPPPPQTNGFPFFWVGIGFGVLLAIIAVLLLVVRHHANGPSFVRVPALPKTTINAVRPPSIKPLGEIHKPLTKSVSAPPEQTMKAFEKPALKPVIKPAVTPGSKPVSTTATTPTTKKVEASRPVQDATLQVDKQQIQNYAKACLAKGFAFGQISATLVKQGWNKGLVDESLNKIAKDNMKHEGIKQDSDAVTDYVNACRKKNFTVEQIKSKLKTSGWSEEVIAKALKKPLI